MITIFDAIQDIPDKVSVPSKYLSQDWIASITVQAESGLLAPVDTPIEPYALNGWKSSAILDAAKSKNPSDRFYYHTWRKWIEEVQLIESQNRTNLLHVLTALERAQKQSRQEHCERLSAYLEKTYGIDIFDLARYFDCKDRAYWIGCRAQKSRGPSNDRRDLKYKPEE